MPDDVIPVHYQLHLTLLPVSDRFSGSVRIDVVVNRPTSRIWLHGDGLNVTSAHAVSASGDRMAARYRQRDDSGVSELLLEEPLETGNAALVFDYNAPFQEPIGGVFKIRKGADDYIYSYFFPNYARRLFPGFDEPRFKATVDLQVVSRPTDKVIANAPVLRSEVLEGGLKRTVFARTAPLPTYVLHVSVGPFDIVDGPSAPPSPVRDQPVPIRAAAARAQGGLLGYALSETPGILAELEQYFGTAYPFAKLDFMTIPAPFSGAMEDAAAITYGEPYLLMTKDTSLLRKREFAYVHAHELAHQWFGNSVTPAWFDDLWLNESFATWLGNRTVAAWAPGRRFERKTQRDGLMSMEADSRTGSLPLRLPIETSEDFTGGFSRLIYGKGNAVLEMFEEFVGPDVFREAVRLHLRRHRFGVVRAADFLNSIEETSGKIGVADALRTFIDQPGVPLVDVDWNCEDGDLDMRVAQSRYRPLGSLIRADRSWQIPFCWSLLYDDAADSRHCALLETRERRIAVEQDTCPAALMPNSGGAGYYRFSLSQGHVESLLTRIPRMHAGEALALEDSLAAGLMAGYVEPGVYISAAKQFAGHPAWDVSLAPIPRLRRIAWEWAEPSGAGALREVMRRLYADRFEALGLDPESQLDRSNPDEAALVRDVLLPLMALTVEDARLRLELVRRAVAYTGFGDDGMLHSERLNATIVPTALAVAVQERGLPFARHLWALLEGSADETFRTNALDAIARISGQDGSRWIRSKLLSDELGSDEAVRLLVEHARVREHRDAVRSWLREHREAFMARLRWYNHQAMLSVSGLTCDTNEIAAIEATWMPVMDQLAGGRRLIDSTVESVRICAAAREANREPLKDWLRLQTPR